MIDRHPDSARNQTSSRSALPELRHVHLLGIGGVGVSGIARILAAQGVAVTGTDARDLPVMHELNAHGAHTYVGYDAANIDRAVHDAGLGIDALIASSVAGVGNPEYDAAIAADIPVYHRSEGLAHTMSGHRVLAVAGTHGKTTTSSMAAMTFTKAGASPTFAVGAAVAGLGVNAAAGSGEWFIAEADESDGTLLNYTPEIAIITNVEPDHLDFYGTAEAVHQVFRDFAARVTGTVVICTDDDGAAELADHVRQSSSGPAVLTYGRAPSADLRLVDAQPDPTGIGQRLTLKWAETITSIVDLPVPGEHNALNAAAVLLAGRRAGLHLEDAIAGLGQFSGTARRFESHGHAGGVRVFDDYAHHPTEVAAAVGAARSLAAGARVHVLFQPHLFTRTRDFASGFARALSSADTVRVLEIYPAREEPIEGVDATLITSELDAELLQRCPLASEVATRDAAVESTVTAAADGDVILTMGAGDVNQLTVHLLDRLNRLNRPDQPNRRGGSASEGHA